MKTFSIAAVMAVVAYAQGAALSKARRSNVCVGVDQPLCANLDPAGIVVSVAPPSGNPVSLADLSNICVGEGLVPVCCASISGSGVGINCYEAN